MFKARSTGSGATPIGPDYPLGNFHAPRRQPRRPGKGGLEPEAGVDLSYFVDRTVSPGRPATMPGDGPTWLSGLVVSSDRQEKSGCSRLCQGSQQLGALRARASRISFPSRRRFQKRAVFPVAWRLTRRAYPEDIPSSIAIRQHRLRLLLQSLPAGSRAHRSRVRLPIPSHRRHSPALKPGTRFNEQQVDRGPMEELRYSWKKPTQLVSQEEQESWRLRVHPARRGSAPPPRLSTQVRG